MIRIENGPNQGFWEIFQFVSEMDQIKGFEKNNSYRKWAKSMDFWKTQKGCSQIRMFFKKLRIYIRILESHERSFLVLKRYNLMNFKNFNIFWNFKIHSIEAILDER